MNDHRKIRFTYENSDGGEEVESMWAIERPEGYEIDNIPFYVMSVAVGDIVAAEPDEEGHLWYTRLIRPSGHSTIRLWLADERDVQKTRDELRTMGCDSEFDLPRLIAVDVPPEIPYGQIRSYLEDNERAGVFEYEEGCLGQSTS
jgi:hypothetical protein